MSGFYHIIVIGAGPSGIMAAITAAKNRKRVLLVDHNDKIAKKLYATGNGRCNFTNEYMDVSCYHGDRELIDHTLAMFNEKDCIRFFHELGILPKSKNGYVYPNSEQATSVVKALEMELVTLGVDIGLQANVQGIERRKNDFIIQIDDEDYRCQKLIIATGLRATPNLGSDGSLLDMIKALGHSLNPVLPSLCGFYCEGIDFKQTAKVRQDGCLTLLVDEQILESNSGEIQFADYGISGIPMFQLSSNAAKALHDKRKVEIEINLLPEFKHEDLVLELRYCYLMKGDTSTIGDVWNGLIVDKLCDAFIKPYGYKSTDIIAELGEEVFEKLADAITKTRVVVNKPRDYEFAQVCTGGIPVSEINYRTLESNIIPDMYFAGELIDVDGICGGYNLQWAFASGYVAGDQAGR